MIRTIVDFLPSFQENPTVMGFPAIRAIVLLLVFAGGGGCSCPQKGPPPSIPPGKEATAPDVELSLFVPEKGRCEWRRTNPVKNASTVVAAFDGDCSGAGVSWRKDLAKAVVRIESTVHRLYEVDLKSGQVRKVPFPSPADEIVEFGYNLKGDLLAFLLRGASEAEEGRGSMLVEGEKIPIHQVVKEVGCQNCGAAAVAYRETHGTWSRVEMAPTTMAWDGAEGIGALKSEKEVRELAVKIQPSLEIQLIDEEQSPIIKDEKTLARLNSFLPKDVEPDRGHGEWMHYQVEGTSVFIWIDAGEFLSMTGVFLFSDGEKIVLPEAGFAGPGSFAYLVSGPFLLVADESKGTHPRLYDLRSRRLLFRSDTARAALFWPKG